MNLDVTGIADTMWAAAKGPLGNAATAAEPFAKSQFTNIAQTVASIAAGIPTGQINQQQATYLLSIQEHATKSALLAVEGLGIVAVESALNAALGAVTGLVNGAVGFALI
jgi:hypothetical protein